MDDNKKNLPHINRIKGLRKDISAVIRDVEDNYSNAEMTIVRQKLKEAKHWCGEYLKVLGSELPEEFRDE